MKITTNNQDREFISFDELNPKDKEDFECCKDGLFFYYKGLPFSLGDFTRMDSLGEWDGSYSLTAFSGVVIKLSPDGSYRVGMALS